MNDEQRQNIRNANRRRTACPQCGGSSIEVVDGAACGGFPGINYKRCTQCGSARAITKRSPRKFKL